MLRQCVTCILSINQQFNTNLPRGNIFPKLLIDDTADGHQVAVGGGFRGVVRPQVVLQVLAVKPSRTSASPTDPILTKPVRKPPTWTPAAWFFWWQIWKERTEVNMRQRCSFKTLSYRAEYTRQQQLCWQQFPQQALCGESDRLQQ